MAASPSAKIFAEVLSEVLDWYSLGIFLGATTQEMVFINQNYRTHGTIRCLIEIYTFLETRGTSLTWNTIETALRKMKNDKLANEIHANHILLNRYIPGTELVSRDCETEKESLARETSRDNEELNQEIEKVQENNKKLHQEIEKVSEELHQEIEEAQRENEELHQEIEKVQENNGELHQEIEEIQKDNKKLHQEIENVQKSNDELKQKNSKLIDQNKHEFIEMKEEILRLLMMLKAITFAIVFLRNNLIIGTEMIVQVTIQIDSSRVASTRCKALLTSGDLPVRAILSCRSKSKSEWCCVRNAGGGTFCISVRPQQLGWHQLSITIIDQHIQHSPFALNVLPKRDYSELNLQKPLQVIHCIKQPMSIAFADNGNMFVTCGSDHCISVFDSSGNKKATVGSFGNGNLQFNTPCGIDIIGDVIYVAEYQGHRLQMLTTSGGFISTFGDKRQTPFPWNVNISRVDSKVYVGTREGREIRVFNLNDWSISHIINAGNNTFVYSPLSNVTFNLLGNCVYVPVMTSYLSTSMIAKYDLNGQLSCIYDETSSVSDAIHGVAIDSSSNLLIAYGYRGSGSLKVHYSHNGKLIRSSVAADGEEQRHVAVSPDDGGVWVISFNALSQQYTLCKY